MVQIVDISRFQNTVDFRKVKKAVAGVILRIGYRGYGDGSIVIDNRFYEYYDGCRKNNINFGIYFFTQARNYSEGRREAEWVIKILKTLDYKPTYPIYIDTENSTGYPNGRRDNISITERTNSIIGFCDTLEKNGYFAGVYRSTSWFHSKLYDDQIKRFSHWVADYRTDANGRHYCGYDGKFAMWQFTSTAKISGIGTNADLNYCYTDFPSIIKRNGLNGFPKTNEPVIIPEPEPPSEPIEIDIPSDDTSDDVTEPETFSDGFIKSVIKAIVKYLIKILG